MTEGVKDPNGNWYVVYFYYPETKEILYCWLKPGNFGSTTIGFVRINHGDRLGNWKDINGDFESSENRAQKRKFERIILEPLKKMLSNGERNIQE